MRGESTLQVDLAIPIPVFIYYTTSIVRADGRIEFYEDIYGLDRALDDALRARTRQRVGSRAEAGSSLGGSGGRAAGQ
jgi:murein L,D-transpeptidase YcbB/YkuD